MKKVIVIGCPGSGKSVFSKELRKITGIPLVHLDMLYWNADGTTVPKEVFLERLMSAVSGDEWIIDGNYASTMEMRIDLCDTVFFLDYPTEVCLDGIEKRRGKARDDLPWVEQDVDSEFVEFVRFYNKKMRPRVFELLDKYQNKDIYVFQNREEGDAFLSSLRQLKSIK